MTNYEIEVAVGSHSFKASGSEEFVKAMFLEHAKPWLDSSPPSSASAAPEAPPFRPAPASGGVSSMDHNSKQAGRGSDSSTIPDYENVFDFADDELKIICDVGGANKAQKTRRTVLTYLFGQALLGEATVQSEQLRAACTDQGCYDSTNFAQYLKGLKNKVVMNTKAGGGYAVKLTAPGRIEAKKLVQELNGNEDG